MQDAKDSKDLKISSSISYHTVKGKRVILPNPKSHSGPFITRNLCMHMTPFLTLEFWKRHNYTPTDIEITLRSFQPFHLWGMCMTLHLPPTRATVQPAYASEDTLIFGAKAPAVRQLMQYVQSIYPDNPNTESVLRRRTSKHKPVLPVHLVEDSGLFKQYIKHRLDHNTAKVFQWKDIAVVPIRVEDEKYLLMTRVASELVYLEKFGETKIPGLQPTIVKIGDQNFVLLEESFFLISNGSYIM